MSNVYLYSLCKINTNKILNEVSKPQITLIIQTLITENLFVQQMNAHYFLNLI